MILFRTVVFKPVLQAPLPSTFCLSTLSDTPDSTHQLVSRDCKTWIVCVWQGRHTKCAGQGCLQDRFENHWFRAWVSNPAPNSYHPAADQGFQGCLIITGRCVEAGLELKSAGLCQPRTRVSCWIVMMRSFWHHHIQGLVLCWVMPRKSRRCLRARKLRLKPLNPPALYMTSYWRLWSIEIIMNLSGHKPSARASLPFFLNLHVEVEKEWKKHFFSRIHRFQHTSYADIEGMHENGYEPMGQYDPFLRQSQWLPLDHMAKS